MKLGTYGALDGAEYMLSGDDDENDDIPESVKALTGGMRGRVTEPSSPEKEQVDVAAVVLTTKQTLKALNPLVQYKHLPPTPHFKHLSFFHFLSSFPTFFFSIFFV